MDKKAILRKYAVINFLSGISAGLVLPIMYVVLTQKGIDVSYLGVLVLCATVSTILVEVPGGVLSDKYGRKICFLIGQLFLLLSTIGIFLFSDIVFLGVAMLCAGLSVGLTSGTIEAIFIEEFNRSDDNNLNTQEAIAKMSFFNLSGLTIGAACSGVITTFPFILGEGFEKNYFMVSLLNPFVALIVLLCIHEKKRSTPHSPTINGVLENYNLLKKSLNKNIKSLLISSSIAASGYICIEKFWQIKVWDFDQMESVVWVFGGTYLFTALISMFGQLISSKVCNVFGNNYVNTVIFTRVVLSLLFFLIYFVDSLTSFILVFVGISFTSALSSSPVMALFHNEVKDDSRSTMLSIRSLMIQLGATFGIGIIALVNMLSSLDVAFVVSSILYLISIIILLQPNVRALGRELSKTV